MYITLTSVNVKCWKLLMPHSPCIFHSISVIIFTNIFLANRYSHFTITVEILQRMEIESYVTGRLVHIQIKLPTEAWYSKNNVVQAICIFDDFVLKRHRMELFFNNMALQQLKSNSVGGCMSVDCEIMVKCLHNLLL